MIDEHPLTTVPRQEILLSALEKAVKMRALQKDYFRTRNLKTLRQAQLAEREFDRLAATILGGA